jgi:1-phosphofructokinase
MSPAPPVLTLTGNLLAERTFEFETWAAGRTQRATRESFQVGGKGINVSKMLRRLGVANTALCFPGGAPGAECEAWMRAAGLAVRAFPTSRTTRTGLVVRGRHQAETTFLGGDAAPDATAIRACAEFLSAQPAGGVLVVSGSLPGWDSSDYDVLREALHRWPERGSLIVDTYGPALLWFAREAVTFLRINRAELETLFAPAEAKLSSGELLRQVRDRSGTLRWAVSDGAAPVWFMDQHQEPETIVPPVVRQVSPTGSGDVMLACIIQARFCQQLTWREALVWSLPFASANAAHPGIADFELPAL